MEMSKGKKEIKICVAGGGNGGYATAGELTLRGFEVRMFEVPEFAETIEPIKAEGGITVKSVESSGLPSGKAMPKVVTTNAREAVEGADVILLLVPSFAHDPFAKEMAKVLAPGQTVVISPSNPGGAPFFEHALQRYGARPGVIVGEMACLIYACRKGPKASVDIDAIKRGLQVAALPTKNNAKLLELLREIYPDVVPAKNILVTGLCNVNTVCHPTIALMNLGRIEDTNGEFFFYYQGSTPAVGRLIEAMDQERIAVGRAFGVDLPPTWKLVLDWYAPYGATGSTIYETHHSNPAYRNSKAPRSLKERYITEDIPYGLVPVAELGDCAGVETPNIDAVIRIGCTVAGQDFVAQARGLKAIGWGGLSVKQIMAKLE